MAGILLQWSCKPQPLCWYGCGIVASLVLLLFTLLPAYTQFRFRFLNGMAIQVLMLAAGGWICQLQDIRNEKKWIGHHPNQKEILVLEISSEIIPKEKSFKAEARVRYGLQNGFQISRRGKILLYFRQDDHRKETVPAPGSKLLLQKPLQEIRNSGNPGAFDYRQYALFHGITHQVFLTSSDYIAVPENHAGVYQHILWASQQKLLDIIRRYIPGTKEKGLAEALLIGYKHDLDPELVQSYANTGVVHIIAISGLHLGLIYWLLQSLLQPLAKKKTGKWLRPLLIIAGLWAFSLLAGAQPSVLRSALMFSMIVLAGCSGRKTSVFNSLAASATILLVINPYWLWDPGFQLSYAAVTSIMLFMKPVYNLLYFPNKFIDLIWKMNAVTIAAQILTLPLTVYYFHQFPLLFLVSNLIAVPLSSFILLGEILLVLLSAVPAAAVITGQLLSFCIRLMNQFMEYIEAIPGALWNGLQISFLQSILLLLIVTGACYGYLEKNRSSMLLSLCCLPAFMLLRTQSFLHCGQQQKIIVYNIARHSAIQMINGRNCYLLGDPSLLSDPSIQNYTLKPAQVYHRVQYNDSLAGLIISGNCIGFNGKRILLVNNPIRFRTAANRERIDLLILSKDARVYFRELVKALDIRQVVLDGTVTAGKTAYWKKDCDSLQIPFHAVSINGAFEMKLN
jgi:competence protein ComEC